MTHLPAALALILTLTFVISPALTDPFSGFRADQLPIAQINPPIQPAGYAFAIWGVIYGWRAVSAGFGLWKRTTAVDWNTARWPLIASLAVGTPWLAVANASAILATIMIFVMAIGAIAALLMAPGRDMWLFAVPVGIYAGWLTAASFVSLGSTAAGYGLITDAEGWAYIGILAALTAAAPVLWRSGSAVYGLTIVWALVGIVAANGTEVFTVTALAAAGVIAVLVIMVFQYINGRSVPS